MLLLKSAILLKIGNIGQYFCWNRVHLIDIFQFASRLPSVVNGQKIADFSNDVDINFVSFFVKGSDLICMK